MGRGGRRNDVKQNGGGEDCCCDILTGAEGEFDSEYNFLLIELGWAGGGAEDKQGNITTLI